MRRYLLGFCCGAVALAFPWRADATLPLQLVLVAIVAALLVGGGWFCRWLPANPATALLGLCCGLVWSGIAHHQALTARLGDVSPGNAVAVTARLESSPEAVAVAPGQPGAVRFSARILEVAETTRGPIAGAMVRLTWYGAPALHAGDVWTFQAVLRPPWSYANPGGFDYERWLLGAGIHGTGYVRGGEPVQRAEPPGLQRARQRLNDQLAGSFANAGILQALLTGTTAAITTPQWEVFRATGTVHLMVISGLHVGLAAGLGTVLGRWLCLVWPPLLLWLDGRKSGCLGGMALAAGYVALAGGGLPAMRSLLMTASVLLLLSWGRTARVDGALLVALALLLLMHPLAVHHQGFWLSFGAVAVLLLALGRRFGRQGALSALIRVQLALTLAMLPLVALFTGDLPWTSIPANLIAVPTVSLLVVPLTLLGGLLGLLDLDAAWVAFRLADLALAAVVGWLSWLAGAKPLEGSGGTWPWVCSLLACLALLLRSPRHYIPALVLCAVLPLFFRPPQLPEGGYRVMALDVGQGSAVLIDTRRHRLLFDTGPRFPSGFETGSAVVEPSLKATGAGTLDLMLLSHDDIDHVGGAGYLLQRGRVAGVLSGSPRADAEDCHGRNWVWDGVRFRVLKVPRPTGASDNDLSCVLLVDDGRYRTLIAGDVSARVEAPLVRALDPISRRVHLLFAPHHGSLTSSSPAFVRLLGPQLVFVSAGRNNRYGHPHPTVLGRYADVGARVYQTGRHGALVWHSRQPEQVLAFRRDRRPYWRNVDQVEPGEAASSR